MEKKNSLLLLLNALPLAIRNFLYRFFVKLQYIYPRHSPFPLTKGGLQGGIKAHLHTELVLELSTQYSRLLKVIFISCVIGVLSWVLTPSAVALTQIKLTNLSYHECPQELAQGAVTSGGTTMAANCFIVTGKAQNGTNKTVYDADIFGRIYDANNDSVMQNRTRLGSIEEIPPGDSNFELRISVPANQPLPLKLKQFKAAGFGAQVRR